MMLIFNLNKYLITFSVNYNPHYKFHDDAPLSLSALT